ncbi:CMP-N-acetylneuraminate-poly-alpha-2,8-sialyltransferase-like [Glandiceps talaboti]
MDHKITVFCVLILVSCIVTVMYIGWSSDMDKLSARVPQSLEHQIFVNVSSAIQVPNTNSIEDDWCENCQVNSLAELRDRVSKVFDLKTSLAIYKDHIVPKLMKFPHIFSVNETSPGAFSFDNYDDTFYTVKPQKSCAIIGGSGILKNSGCGKEIDTHDFVLRANLPIVRGFEKDVGSKTHITALNKYTITYLRNYIQSMDKRSNTENKYADKKRYLTSLSYLGHSIIWLTSNLTLNNETRPHLAYTLKETIDRRNYKYRVAYSPIPLYPLPVRRFWHRGGSSEGFIIFTIATLFCEEISLYGFWPFPKDSHGMNIGHHYYENTRYPTNLKTLKGTIPKEFLTYKTLHERGVVNLVTDKCSSTSNQNRGKKSSSV